MVEPPESASDPTENPTKEPASQPAEPAGEATSPAAPSEASSEKPSAAYELPPANFTTLVTTLASQAMVAFGQFPGPDGKQSPPDVVLSRHFIDTLQMLQEKTAGNLDAAEVAMLESILHQLRMTYVSVKKEVASQ